MRQKLGSGFSSGKQHAALASSPLSPLWRAIDCVPGCILDLDVLLDPKVDVLYLGDFMLHQVLVEGVGDL